MENEDSVDIDSNENVYTDSYTADVQLNDYEDESYSDCSEYSDDGHNGGDADKDDGDDTDDDDDDVDDDSADKHDGEFPVEVDAGDRMVRIDSITSDEICALEFSTVEEAYEFYYRYGKCKGFAIRKSELRRGGSKGNKRIVMRQFVCNRHGEREQKHLYRIDRKREHRRMTRTNCRARLRVHYKSNKDRYVVSIFEEGHNHELTPSKFVHLHPVYRNISEADKAQIDGLQSHGIRTCHIMGYMVAQKGGYGGVGFTKKDLYNYFDKKMRDVIKDGDVEASLNYLKVKSGSDPMLYAEYGVDSSNGRMKCLFWADGISRSDYFCFGDVVAFDTTYKKNKYNYPLVIFSGCNHHAQTVIFAAAVISDETTDTYKWVLNCFLECMQNKHPQALMTDEDGAMREAIKHVFPQSTHRLCAWHLNRNACKKVSNSVFLTGFQKAIYGNFTKDEFEDYWADLVKKSGVENSSWVAKTYHNKSLWATAYLRDRFFGRIRTTSQCEAINAIIKSYVRKKSCIYEFLHSYDEAVRVYRNNEVVADFKSKYTDPVLTTQLPLIESHAAKIYTADVFKDVKLEIIKAGALIVKDKLHLGDTKIYKLTKYLKEFYERQVVYDGLTFQCSCRVFESRGLPCSHMFYVMKEEHVDHIPHTLILSRWTKDAKSEYLNMDFNGTGDSNLIEQARFGAYSGAFTIFCREASKKKGVYGQIMEDILNMQKKYCSNEDDVVTQNPAVGDPEVVIGKGAPKKKKNETRSVKCCTICKSTTHNARTCAGKRNVESDAVSLGDSLSHTDKHDKTPDGSSIDMRPPLTAVRQSPVITPADSSSLSKRVKRKKRCDNGTTVQEKCSVAPQKRGVTTTSNMNVPAGPIPPTHVFPPVMHSVGTSMQVQPIYPIYGMPVANSNSCFGLLQQVMKSAGRQ